ncbi:hypothetical protein QFZ40_004370 [Arthrobacter pascens]|nr:hypothetical protein [Arthrobacter pascens]
MSPSTSTAPCRCTTAENRPAGWPVFRGRSPRAVRRTGPPALWSPATDRRYRSVLLCPPGAPAPPRIRETTRGSVGTMGERHARRTRTPSGVRFAAGCWVQCAPSQSSGHPGPACCLRRFLVAVLRILGVRSTPSSPSFVGACSVRISLRRSCVADFLREFPPPCPRVDRAPSAAEQASLPATKKQRGERGSWPVT